jgi:hypothetical protein
VLNGIHLTLLIGPGVPVPAPEPVTDALTSVTVTNGQAGSGFQLTFAVSKLSPLQTILLPAGYFDPISTRVIIIVTAGGVPNVLMDGIVTRQEVAPSNDPGKSTLTITGEDLSVLMDVVEMPFMRYPNMTDDTIVTTILARYAEFGIQPAVTPPIFTNAPVMTENIPTQTGTDLQYMKLLASRNSYVFFVSPGPTVGNSIGYWGPDFTIPVPQPALNVNMDAETNVQSISFSLDGLAKKIVVLTVYDPETDRIPIPIPVPNLSILRPPLGARLTPPAKIEFPDYLSGLTATEAIARALGIVFSASDAITGSGQLDVLRYGGILQARQVVGVRGAGPAYDGLYYVQSVTHDIKRGQYKQSFSLSRDGLISLTPVVPA